MKGYRVIGMRLREGLTVWHYINNGCRLQRVGMGGGRGTEGVVEVLHEGLQVCNDKVGRGTEV